MSIVFPRNDLRPGRNPRPFVLQFPGRSRRQDLESVLRSSCNTVKLTGALDLIRSCSYFVLRFIQQGFQTLHGSFRLAVVGLHG